MHHNKIKIENPLNLPNLLTINNDAVFIADSHTQDGRYSLISTLQKLSNISQIFLLGDISNLLIGNLKSSIKANQYLLETLESLSNKTQIIYFEGNHDFQLTDFHLTSILPRVLKIPRCNQPLFCRFGDKFVLLAHGDLFLDKKYEIYITMLTSKLAAKVFGVLDSLSCGRIYSLIDKNVRDKDIRFPTNTAFIDTLIERRISSYQHYIQTHNLHIDMIDMIIEGHFHLGKIIKRDNLTYIALPAFHHNQNVFHIGNNSFDIL